jgi:hypothetical protein
MLSDSVAKTFLYAPAISIGQTSTLQIAEHAAVAIYSGGVAFEKSFHTIEV